MQNFQNELKQTRSLIDRSLETWLKLPKGLEKRLTQSMAYSAIGGGKAFRAFLVMTVGDMFQLPRKVAIQIATALEMIHTYSLIHDDLPAMDNDKWRRGKPTNHIQFDEATAILAGDSLLTLAFQVLSDKKLHLDSEKKCALINLLAQLSGHTGMAGGQMIDLIGEKKPLSLKEIKRLQNLKTGALLTFAVIASAIASNASQKEIKALTEYAHYIGLLFQITDDILDVTGTEKQMGKTLGKDKLEHKSTFVTCMGLKKAQEEAKKLNIQAKKALMIFGENANLLRQAADFILMRNY